MKMEIIDGNVASAIVKQASAKATLYTTWVFELAIGAQRMLENAAVSPVVNASIVAGTRVASTPFR